MGIFSKSKKKNELVLVFDIGSSSVGGSFFYMESSGIPKIIYSIREPISIQNEVSFDTLLSLIIKSLDTVANKICMMGFGKPDKTFCFLSSLLYGSQTRTIKLEKNNPFIFTLKIADSLIKKEISISEEEHLIKHIHPDEKIRLIELKNMKIMLNGYAVDKPLDQKIKELEMNIFISMSGEEMLKKIEYAISRYFDSKNIKFSSFVMASFTVIRDMFAHHENFLLVDIGGEITDISIIKKGVLCESISFPNGRNFIIRGVAISLNISLDEAKSLISLYKDDHMKEQIKNKFNSVINKLKDEWLKKFQESLFNISNNIFLPSNIFLTVDKDYADFFVKIIKTEQFNQYSLTESKFKITLLDAKELHGIATFNENIDRDSFLSIESIYINRLSDKI